MINVKDYGAYGDGAHDDTNAIQSAINFAKSQTSVAGPYQITVFFPAGFYYIIKPINITNAYGIWLKGDGGTYLNTSIIGVTSGIIFDFSGSSVSGCEGFSFISNNGNGANQSTIGVQFALTGNGGLTCGIKNCYFQMQDLPSSNGGLGTVGIMGIRSDELYINECLIRTNSPIVLSNSVSLAEAGVSYTASSTYQTLSVGTGSLGPVNIQAVSLQNYEKRRPALILNGVNSLNFQGYLSRATANNGTNESAIQCSQYTTNLRIHANIESFSRVLQLTNCSLENNEFNVVSANVTSPTTELVNSTNCYIKGLKLRLSLPVVSERSNRYILYHAPNSDPNQPLSGTFAHSEITCYDINSNQYSITPALLKNAENVVFNTSRPFEKKGGRVKELSNNVVNLGTVGSPSSSTVFRFIQADNVQSSNGKGGFYKIWIEGVIQAGSYGSAYTAVMSFQAQLLITQNYVGNMTPASNSVIILDKSTIDPSFIDIIGLSVNINFVNRIGNVSILPRTIGSSSGEAIRFEGCTQLQTDFLVNESVPL